MSDLCSKCGAAHLQCKAHTRRGLPCRQKPMQGQRVCRMHGGSSPQAISSARERLASMVDPALRQLSKLIRSQQPGVSLAAVRDILDRNGLKAADVLELGGKGGGPLEVIFVRPEPKL